MKSFEFPKMFNSNSSRMVTDLDATKQNALLVLKSEKGELFGDPFFGIRLKRYLFEQNNYVLKDIIIDEIYTQLAVFMPQLKVNRKDIKIIQDKEKAKLYCSFKAINKANYEWDTYNLVLFEDDQE